MPINLKTHSEYETCPECGEYVRYRVLVNSRSFEDDGMQLQYIHFQPVCPKCGKEMTIGWITEYNRKTREIMRESMRKRGTNGARRRDSEQS